MSKSIGERMKELRTEQGLTLAELSEMTNLSISYLSQIERDKTIPSLPSLDTIAKIFNTGLRYFFESETEDVCVVRSNKGQTAPQPESQPLTPQDWNPRITVKLITSQPGISSDLLEQFTAEEIVLILSGELTISVGDERYDLSTGDSIHYDAMQPHSWKNESVEVCTFLWSRAFSISEHQL